MELDQLLSLRVPASALGLDPDTYAAVLDHALDRAELAVTGLPADKQGEGAEAHALAALLRLELAHTRRQYSGGTGPDGGFTYSELSARMAELKAEIGEQEARLKALSGPVQPQQVTRGSGSVGVVFEV